MSEFYSDNYQFVSNYFNKCNPKQQRDISFLFKRGMNLSFFDLLAELIRRTNIKVIYESYTSFNTHRGDDDSYSGYYSSKENTLSWGNADYMTLKHETAHAIDHYLNLMTLTYKIESFNKTFFEVIVDELKEKYRVALDALFEQYREPIEKRYGPFIFDKIKPFFTMHSRMYSIDEDRRNRSRDFKFFPLLRNHQERLEEENKIFKVLTESGYVEYVLTAFEHVNDLYIESFHKMNVPERNELLVELLSTNLNFKPFTNYYGHGSLYFAVNVKLIPIELFAELFSLYNPDDDTFKNSEDLFFTYFPNTVKAFKELYKYLVNALYDDSFVHIDKPVTNISYCLKTLNSISHLEPREYRKRGFRGGLNDALANNKHEMFSTLTKHEKEILYDIILSMLERRKDLFKFMFGEKFKYQTYIDFNNKIAPLSMTYRDVYIINQKFGKNLAKLIKEQMLYKLKSKDCSFTKYEGNRILKALIFR